MHKHYHNIFWWIITGAILCGNVLIAQIANANTPTPEQAGSLSLRTEDGQTLLAPMLDTKVSATIDGLIASVTYTQRFTNDSDKWVEGVYRFPLGEKSAVTAMRMRIGEREIIGKIKQKQKALKIYQKAKAEGKQAALTEQNRSNFFTQHVANLGPNETIEVELQYQERVEYRDGEFEWRLPTTFTPRYSPNLFITQPYSEHQDKQETQTSPNGWILNPLVLEDAKSISPPFSRNTKNALDIEIELNSGLNLASISSPYHDIKIKKETNVHKITLPQGGTEMDRDFVLQWTPVVQQAPRAAVFTEEVDGEHFAMLMLLPPQKNVKKLAKDIVFIVDTSGSMQGNSIQQAKQSLILALDKLKPEDRFNLIEFNSEYRSVFPRLSNVNENTLFTAKKWVASLSADGGTEMKAALAEGFRQFEKNEKLKQLIFITDGAIGNEAELFTLIHQKVGDVRLFNVGIGSAPNSYFMKKSAEFGRGTYTHIGNQQEVGGKMDMLFNKIEGAIAQAIHVDWQVPNEQYPKRIGDLYQGEPLVVITKLNKKTDTASASGITQADHWNQSINVSSKSTSTGLSRLWAREKIDDIENQEISNSISSAAAEKQITKLALKHSLLSRFTSFVAVENKRARPKNQNLTRSDISNQIANGQTMTPLNFPKTATPSSLYLCCGVFSLLCSLLLRLRGRRK